MTSHVRVGLILVGVGVGCGGEPPLDLTQGAAFGGGAQDVGIYYRLRSVSTAFCMDVSGASQTAGATVLQWDCSANQNQQWYLRQLSATDYQLSAKHSALCLRVSGGSTASGAGLVQDVCARSGAAFNGTRFTLTAVGSSSPTTYQLVTQASGQCVRSPSATRGAGLIQNACATSTNFLWTLEPVAPPAASDTSGRWSVVFTLPSIPAAGALLPSGKVITWSSWQPTYFSGTGALDRTFTALFDPASPTTPVGTDVTNTAHNMFCPGTSMLADGRVFVNGGDDSATNTTSIYDAASNGWSNAHVMIERRWYNTSVTLPDGRVFTLGGNRVSGLSGTGEIWSPSANTWTQVPGAIMDPIVAGTTAANRAQEHPRLFVAPDGRLFLPGPTPNMQYYNLSGSGSVQSAGTRGSGAALDEFSQNSVTVMFDVGKILKAGGNPNYDVGGDQARFSPSNQNSYVIDINGGGAAVTKIASMKYPRAFANGVVLPTGQVLVVGGLDNGKGFSDDGAILVPELFTPATASWQELAPMATSRPYHSIAILLPDGRVLVGGGGLCAGTPSCSANHPNVEIFSPPYLFGGTKPVITSAPTTITAAGGTFTLGVSGTVSAVALIRASSVTHSVNTDQRYLRLVTTGSGSTLTVTAPANRNLAPPGLYLLFALNGAAPSVARLVTIN